MKGEGSRTAKVKGMTARKNPLNDFVVSRKRVHHFAENTRNNEAVAKKASRTMSSRTKHHTTRKTNEQTEAEK